MLTKVADAQRVRAAARATSMGLRDRAAPAPRRRKARAPRWQARDQGDAAVADLSRAAEDDFARPRPNICTRTIRRPISRKGIEGHADRRRGRHPWHLHDARRRAREGRVRAWAAAKAKADAGDLARCDPVVRRLLASEPGSRGSRRHGQGLLRWGKQLEAKQQWSDASVAYAKASGLDPNGASATDALAAHHFTQARRSKRPRQGRRRPILPRNSAATRLRRPRRPPKVAESRAAG